jgi:hypothetical protein
VEAEDRVAQLEAKLAAVREYANSLSMRVSGCHPDARQAVRVVAGELKEMLEE